eukprot:g5492.t1
MSSDDEEIEGMEVPGIGASVVAGEVRRLSGDVARKLSDAARKLSGASGRDSAVDDEEDLLDEAKGGHRSMPFCVRLAVALLFGLALALTAGGFLASQRAREVSAMREAPSAPVASAGSGNGNSTNTHGLIERQQRAQLEQGKAISLSCRSSGNIHALGLLPLGANATVDCRPGCTQSEWYKAQEAAIWGSQGAGGNGYADASLVCVAAQHATGEDGGEFVVTFNTAESFSAETAHGIATGAFDDQRRAFTIALRKTTSQLQAELHQERARQKAAKS